MNQTTCHTAFCIQSVGEIIDNVGFVAAENSDFDPDVITQMLGIQPTKTVKIGTLRQGGYGTFPFSEWVGCRQEEPVLDAEEQCLSIVKQLFPLIPQLLEIKRRFQVSFTIVITPHIYNEENPYLSVSKEIIDFCYYTDTEITVDMYIYDKEEPVSEKETTTW